MSIYQDPRKNVSCSGSKKGITEINVQNEKRLRTNFAKNDGSAFQQKEIALCLDAAASAVDLFGLGTGRRFGCSLFGFGLFQFLLLLEPHDLGVPGLPLFQSHAGIGPGGLLLALE